MLSQRTTEPLKTIVLQAYIEKTTRSDTFRTIDMERERGRKSYFVHTMRQDVAILCYKYNTIATKPVSGPLLEGEAAHYY